jgi:DNA-binding SARP family transcriptional activator
MEFGVLGPLEIRRDGLPVLLAGARQRALLAVLLLHAGEVVSSSRLLDSVWGDDPPAAGTTALRVRVSQLRKALGDDGSLIVTRPPGYVIRIDPACLDLHRFERLLAEGDRGLARGDAAGAASALEQALALWRGPALDDLASEQFAKGPIRRLEELRMAARERLVGAELALGRHATVVSELQELVAEHPLRERLWAHLMLALYRGGRKAEALETYRTARRMLVDEIGLEPGPGLKALERQILTEDPALDAGDPGASPTRTVLVVSLADDGVAAMGAVGTVFAR